MNLHQLYDSGHENLLSFAYSLTDFTLLNYFSNGLRDSYYNLLVEKFNEFCATQEDSDINLAFKLISKDTFHYFILHPSVAHSLLRLKPSSKALENILKSILADLILNIEDNDSKHENEIMIFDGILIDFKSDYKFQVFEKVYGSLTCYDDISEVKGKVDIIFKIINNEAPKAMEFIRNNTTLLFFRKDYKNPDSFSSSSYSGYSGLTLITNALEERNDFVKLIDAFYHETIHAIIYFYEDKIHPLVLSDPGDEYFIVSPWSGSKLRINQYCQACFVWFGLYHLWNNWNRESNLPIDRITHFKNRALKGFEYNPYKILIDSKLEPFVHANTKKAIEIMQNLAESELSSLR